MFVARNLCGCYDRELRHFSVQCWYAHPTNRQNENPLISFNCKLTYYMTNIKIKLTIHSIIG